MLCIVGLLFVFSPSNPLLCFSAAESILLSRRLCTLFIHWAAEEKGAVITPARKVKNAPWFPHHVAQTLTFPFSASMDAAESSKRREVEDLAAVNASLLSPWFAAWSSLLIMQKSALLPWKGREAAMMAIDVYIKNIFWISSLSIRDKWRVVWDETWLVDCSVNIFCQ